MQFNQRRRLTKAAFRKGTAAMWDDQYSFHVTAWVLHKRNEDAILFGSGFVREDPTFFGGLEYISPERVTFKTPGVAFVKPV